MKKSYIAPFIALILGIFLVSGCASTKKLVDSYVGKWNYDLETPQGTFSGNMQITHDGNEFHGSLNSDMGSVDLSDLKIEDGKLTANFDMQGNTIDVTGNFEGEVFNGNFSAGGFDMPFKASRSQE